MPDLREKIAEWLADCEKATKGPWERRNPPMRGIGKPFVQAPRAKPDDPYDIEVLGEDDTLYPTREQDIDFIASARTRLPDALQALAVAVEVWENKSCYCWPEANIKCHRCRALASVERILSGEGAS